MITVVTLSTETLVQRIIDMRRDVDPATVTDPDKSWQSTPLLWDLEQLRSDPQQLGCPVFRQVLDEGAQLFLAGHGSRVEANPAAGHPCGSPVARIGRPGDR